MINKLIAKIQKTGAPIVVGLDPMLNYIPEHIQKKAFAEYGETLEGAAEAIWQFNKEIVDISVSSWDESRPERSASVERCRSGGADSERKNKRKETDPDHWRL